MILQDAISAFTLSGAFDVVVKFALVLAGFVARGIFRRLEAIEKKMDEFTLKSHGRLTALETALKLRED